MSVENPNLSSPSGSNEKVPKLSLLAQEAMNDLKRTLKAQNIPENERTAMVAEFNSKLDGIEDPEQIDSVLGNMLLRSTKRARELKSMSSSSVVNSQPSGLMHRNENPQKIEKTRSNLLSKYETTFVDGEIVDDEIPRLESNGLLKEINKGPIMSTDQTIPPGEHWIVPSVMSSDVVVSPGAKLTIKGALMSSDVMIKKGGIFELKGPSMSSDIVKE